MQAPEWKGTKELVAPKGCEVFPDILRGMDWMSSAALDEVDEDGQPTEFRGMRRRPETMLVRGPGLRFLQILVGCAFLSHRLQD